MTRTPLYPLRLTYGEGDLAIVVVISRDGWKFATPSDQRRFRSLRMDARLDLRRALAAQVELAQATPTKGDNA